MIIAKITSRIQELIFKEDQLPTKVEIRLQGTKLSAYGNSKALLKIGEWKLEKKNLRRDFQEIFLDYLDQYWSFEEFSKLVIYLVDLDIKK